MALVSSFLDLVQQVSHVMTAPTFERSVIVLTGWVFARGRTVTHVILAAEVQDTKHHSVFHRDFASARWSLDKTGFGLFQLILLRLDEEEITLTLDDTLARRRGPIVYGVGMHYDPLLSARRTAVRRLLVSPIGAVARID